MKSHFVPDTRASLLELFAAGLSIPDAAREAGVPPKTVKSWLTRGRNEKDGEYAEFASAVDAARQEAADRERPMDEAELMVCVSRSAKKGSVAAQKLLWEMQRAATDDTPDESASPFDALDAEDELAKRRKAS